MTTVLPAPTAVARDLAERSEVIWLTTVRSDGQPQPSPVWFVFDGKEFLVFSQDATPKVRNIAAHPRVSLTLEADEGGIAVIVEAIARIVDGPRADAHPVYLEKYRDGMARLGTDAEAFSEEYRVPIRIAPTRWRTEDVS